MDGWMDGWMEYIIIIREYLCLCIQIARLEYTHRWMNSLCVCVCSVCTKSTIRISGHTNYLINLSLT